MTKGSRQKQFEELFLTMYPKVKNFAARLLCSEDDAEDIAQDIFVKIWNTPFILKETEMWSSYIFTMTKNRVLDFLRRKSVKDNYSSKTPEWLNIDTDTGDAVHEKMYAREIELITMMAVKKMPEQRRKCFCMSRIEKLSNAEIAEQLELSVRTVERHIYLALNDIRDTMALYSPDKD